MADINQFGSAKPARGGEGTTCAQCEAMLPDWMDNAPGGELTAKDRAAFELHIATCAECSQMLADAQRGAALLEMLKFPRPEPSSVLLDRILANTSGAGGQAKSRVSGITVLPALDGGEISIPSFSPTAYTPATSAAPASVVASPGSVLPFHRPGRPGSPLAGRFTLSAITQTMMQPRLAMTAAMAFFSIALTLNLTGVRLNQLSISDLKPSNIRRTFYQADASVVRYYDNLRVVYELESRVQDMKRSSDNSSSDADRPLGDSNSGSGANSGAGNSGDKTKTGQPHKDAPKAGSGTSQRHNPMQRSFMLAVWRDGSLSPEVRPMEPAMLLKHVVHQSVFATDKLKDAMQEGVLA